MEFSEEQHVRLVETLKVSYVSYMFYDEKYCGHGRKKRKTDQKGETPAEEDEPPDLKEVLMDTIRDNRKKHTLWRLSDDSTQNAVIKEATKNWYNPLSQSVNVAWIEAHKAAKQPTLQPLDTPLEGSAGTTPAPPASSAAVPVAAANDDDDDDDASDSMPLQQRMDWLRQRLMQDAATTTPKVDYRSLGADTLPSDVTHRSLGTACEDEPIAAPGSSVEEGEESIDVPVEDEELSQRLSHALLLAAEPREWGHGD